MFQFSHKLQGYYIVGATLEDQETYFISAEKEIIIHAVSSRQQDAMLSLMAVYYISNMQFELNAFSALLFIQRQLLQILQLTAPR